MRNPKTGERFIQFVTNLLATFAGVYLAFGLEKGVAWYWLVALIAIIVVFVLSMLMILDKRSDKPPKT